MSGIFGATVIKGTRLTDFAQSGASVGSNIPWGWGAIVVDGNVIWAPLPPKEHRKLVRQGKGGVKQETFTYTLSYAVAFSKKISKFRWIKRNGKVVYTSDPAAPIEDLAYSAKWLQKATLYVGGETQMPDPTIESYEGMGQVSAFRDISLIVLEDDDVTEGGGAVPNYQACVQFPGTLYLTTPPYPVEEIEGLGISFLVDDRYYVKANIDALNMSFGVVGGILSEPYILYDEYSPEAMEITGFSALGGTLREILKTYTNYPPEAMSVSFGAVEGSIRVGLVQYQNYPPEAIGVTFGIVGGTLV